MLYGQSLRRELFRRGMYSNTEADSSRSFPTAIELVCRQLNGSLGKCHLWKDPWLGEGAFAARRPCQRFQLEAFVLKSDLNGRLILRDHLWMASVHGLLP